MFQIFFAFGLLICKQLQKKHIDLKRTLSIVDDLISSLKRNETKCKNWIPFDIWRSQSIWFRFILNT